MTEDPMAAALSAATLAGSARLSGSGSGSIRWSHDDDEDAAHGSVPLSDLQASPPLAGSLSLARRRARGTGSPEHSSSGAAAVTTPPLFPQSGAHAGPASAGWLRPTRASTVPNALLDILDPDVDGSVSVCPDAPSALKSPTMATLRSAAPPALVAGAASPTFGSEVGVAAVPEHPLRSPPSGGKRHSPPQGKGSLEPIERSSRGPL